MTALCVNVYVLARMKVLLFLSLSFSLSLSLSILVHLLDPVCATSTSAFASALAPVPVPALPEKVPSILVCLHAGRTYTRTQLVGGLSAPVQGLSVLARNMLVLQLSLPLSLLLDLLLPARL